MSATVRTSVPTGRFHGFGRIVSTWLHAVLVAEVDQCTHDPRFVTDKCQRAE